ncbi:hypothetical protein DYBT9275_05123 [Dyadobacter sp. CECT 9275]|uniref:VCBS repeat-containing protein n=1 Tax=Dyadobacter helix TaxID=2822344 RepID=A0A916JH11_9BACT|nr:hypothetical protein [Dyadobacter sp. CECT 9275]CAG5012178.1 hypothetical protein DYBT9275_05123 [Dyadobacter sp. CECT 9275]
MKNLCLILVVVCLTFISSLAFSQIVIPLSSEFESFKEGPVYDKYDLFYGDINKDGNKDIIAMGDATVFVHFNVTSKSTSATMLKRVQVCQFAQQAYENYNRSVTDFDDDGVLDLVYYSKTIAFYFRGIKTTSGNKIIFSKERETVK